MAEAGAKAAAGDVVAAILQPVNREDEDYETRVRRRAHSAVIQLGALVTDLEWVPEQIEEKHAKLERHLKGKAAELRDAKRDLAQAKRDFKAAEAFYLGLDEFFAGQGG